MFCNNVKSSSNSTVQISCERAEKHKEEQATVVEAVQSASHHVCSRGRANPLHSVLVPPPEIEVSNGHQSFLGSGVADATVWAACQIFGQDKMRMAL